jgi:hypothetical protein
VKSGFGVVVVFAVLLAAAIFPAEAFSQDKVFQVTLHSFNDSLLRLPNEFIIPKSIKLTIDSNIFLQENRDYRVDSSLQFLILSEQFRKTFFSLPSGDTRIAPEHRLEIKYSVFPFHLHRSYTTYKPYNFSSDKSFVGNATGDSSVYTSTLTKPSSENELNLTKSGGITRGIQAGSTQDLAFTNSFNLTFSGDLGEELSFKGAVSEESTPLQPEGNTQILRDVDRIYIEMNAGKYFSTTLGDYTLDLKPKKKLFFHDDAELDPIFNNFSRKVLGAKANVTIGPTEIIANASATKGKFTTFTIQGLDAVQGPYRLQGKNGENGIIVIAGTEHVYIDGILLMRGEVNDYVIDYGLSEITFTNKRIITSASRITVDYEYTDDQYSRTMIAASQTSDFFDNRVLFTTSYIREGDNENSPQNLTLSDSDKTILANAGANPLKAGKSGVSIAGRDSLGRARGNYVRIDTLITAGNISFYRYAPFDTVNAIYNIGFGFIGTSKGSYIRNAIGEFTFVGVGLGDYDTTIYLPLPQRNQLFTSQLTVVPLKSLALNGEFATSDLNPNLFAPQISITDNAYRLYGVFSDTIGLFNISVKYKERFQGASFTPIDRDRKVEELRDYGLDQPINNYSFALTSERERKAALAFGVAPAVLSLQYGLYNRGEAIYHAERYGGSLIVREDSAFAPSAIFSAAHILTLDSSSAINSIWNSYSASIHKTYRLSALQITPGFQYISEKKAANNFGVGDSLSPQSFQYDQFTPSVDIIVNPKIKFGGLVQFRSEDSARAGSLIHISNGATYQFSSSLNNFSGFSSQIDIGYRKKEYQDSISKFMDGGNVSSLLLRLIPRYQSANNVIAVDGIYEASEQRAAQIQRVFFPVQKGLGNYKYLGDLNHNGKQDPEEFALATYADEGAYILLTLPTEALYPVIDLRSSLHLRFNPLSFFGTETSVRIEENSSDPHSSDIYLFKLSHFLTDTSTLRGLIELQQDVNILDNDPTQSYRLRFLERKNAVQYNTGLEQTYFRELSLRARYRVTYELNNETNIIHDIDNARSDVHSTNPSHSTQRIDIRTEWTYEPFASALGFGLKGEIYFAKDNSFTPIAKATLNSLSASARYTLSSTTRLRAELGRDELDLTNVSTALALPYALTQGRNPSATWLWSLSLDVQVASGIVLTASYNGRSELANGTDRSIIHNGRAEVRASF